MAVSTDTLDLNNTEMFAKIRDSLTTDIAKTENLLDCRDDMLLAWNCDDSCLLAINWRELKVKGVQEVKHETLIPSQPQTFDVEKILVSIEGTYVAIAGPRGLGILEIPRRWGSLCQSNENKERTMCKTYNIDKAYFLHNTHFELLQIRWHPGSPTDSHILALFSNNTIHLYDEGTLKHTWRIGPMLSSQPSSKSYMPSLDSLGEIAIDFDIAPPRTVAADKDKTMKSLSTSLISNQSLSKISILTENEEKVEWPIIILRGNGNVYILSGGIDAVCPHLQGPLTILPQSHDNYGVDSCSLLVIPSLPPTIVIAESTGKLHHALLLPAETAEESSNDVDLSLNIYPSEWTINVLETVELELGLPDVKKYKSHNCPIHLKRDFINETRYFAYHNTGLHVVTVNFLKELQHFIEDEKDASLLSLSAPSHAEYILCTKVQESNKINAVLGFVLLQMPAGIVLLLGSGQVISLNLIIDPNLLCTFNLSSNVVDSEKPVLEIIKSLKHESFVTHIQNILKKTATQPILSINKSSEPNPEEAYEFLTQAIQTLRENYKNKHEQARVEILKRVKTLKILKEQQAIEIESLNEKKDIIQNNAERLAEIYDDLNEKQRDLSKRYQNLIRLANIAIPNDSLAEKDFKKDVEELNEATKNLEKRINQAQKKIKLQELHIEKYATEYKAKQIVLPQEKEEAIRDILTKMGEEIKNQIQEITRLNAVVNVKSF